MERMRKYQENKVKAYALIYGQCTNGLKNRLESRKDWANIKNEPIKLLRAIKEVTHNFQDNKYPITSIYKSIQTVMNLKQEEKESISSFTKRFKSAVDIMETIHGKLPLTKYVNTMIGSKDEKRVYREEAYDKFIAYAYLQAADKNKVGKLDEDLANNYAMGQDEYPIDLAKATDLIIGYQNKVNNPNHPSKKKGEQKTSAQGVGFYQKGNQKGKKTSKTISVMHVARWDTYQRTVPRARIICKEHQRSNRDTE